VLAPYLFTVYLGDIRRSFDFNRETFIIMYTDDILLLAPSVCELQKLLLECEAELELECLLMSKSHAAYASVHGALFRVPVSKQPMVWNYQWLAKFAT
jgi:hypothetical protein